MTRAPKIEFSGAIYHVIAGANMKSIDTDPIDLRKMKNMIENKSVTFSGNPKLKKQCAGLGLIGWIAMIPVVLIIILVLAVGFFEGRKAYWDHKVRELCEKDGGATVYEKIEISLDEYEKLGGINGVIPIPDETSAKTPKPFYSRTRIEDINTLNPKVTKRITEIIRRDDGKILGKQVIYSRVGGDIPTVIGHPTYFSCQNVPDVSLDIERQIFIINGDVR